MNYNTQNETIATQTFSLIWNVVENLCDMLSEERAHNKGEIKIDENGGLSIWYTF